MIILRNNHRPRRPRIEPWLVIMALIALLILALTGCASPEDLCWTPNANKTCPSILNIGQE